MEKCNCYEVKTTRRYLDKFDQGRWYERTGKVVEYVDEEFGICNGTKERDHCTCNGDQCYCTFYDRVSQAAIDSQKKKLDKLELDFYRQYILDQGLLYDALNKYESWKKERGHNNESMC